MYLVAMHKNRPARDGDRDSQEPFQSVAQLLLLVAKKEGRVGDASPLVARS
jgi:hypothetical protein